MEKWSEFFQTKSPKHFQVLGQEIREARVYVTEKILNDTEEELFENPEEFFKIVIACTPLEKNDKDPWYIKQAVLFTLSRWALKKFVEVIENPEEFKNLNNALEFMRTTIERENIRATTMSKN